MSEPRSEDRFGLFRFRSPLLTESRLLSFPPATEMFQFAGFAPNALYIQAPVSLAGWVSPLGDSRIKAWLPAPRDLSQAPTSFIASQRQDIHHLPLLPGHADPIPTERRAQIRASPLAGFCMFPASTFPHRQTCTPWGGLFLPESISPGDETWAANLLRRSNSNRTSIRSRFVSLSLHLSSGKRRGAVNLPTVASQS